MILKTNHIKWTDIESVDLNNYDDLDLLFKDTVNVRLKNALAEKPENAIEKRNQKNFVKLCEDLIANKDLEEYRHYVDNVDKDGYENFSCNNSIFTTKSEPNDDYLIINLISRGNMETKYFFPYTSYRPSSILGFEVPVLCVAEDSLVKPYWYSPPNMVDGNGAVQRKQMLEVITQLSYKISKCKRVILISDCRNVAGALGVANELEFVTDCCLLNGLTTMLPDKLGFNMKNDYNIAEWKVWTYIKGNELLKNVDEKHLDPFPYIRKDLNVNYWYGKYDEDFVYFRDYASKFIDNIYEVDYKFGSNVHFVMPYWDSKILKPFLSNLII